MTDSDEVIFEVTEVDGETHIRAFLPMLCNKTATFPGVGNTEMTERVKRETASHLLHYKRWMYALAATYADRFGGLAPVRE